MNADTSVIVAKYRLMAERADRDLRVPIPVFVKTMGSDLADAREIFSQISRAPDVETARLLAIAFLEAHPVLGGVKS